MEAGDEDIEEVKKNYLYAIRRRIDRNIKLRPIEGDMEAYDELFTNNSENFIKNTGITSNYELFYELIKVSGLTFQNLIAAIEKLEIIDIRLESKDNPQLILNLSTPAEKILKKLIR